MLCTPKNIVPNISILGIYYHIRVKVLVNCKTITYNEKWYHLKIHMTVA